MGPEPLTIHVQSRLPTENLRGGDNSCLVVLEGSRLGSWSKSPIGLDGSVAGFAVCFVDVCYVQYTRHVRSALMWAGNRKECSSSRA